MLNDLANSNLEPDVVAFLNEIEDNESLDGDAYISDEESNVSLNSSNNVYNIFFNSIIRILGFTRQVF